MISTHVLTSASDTDKYFFGTDKYYTKEGKDFDKEAQWWGKGAKILGLNENVSRDIFRQLLQGKLPSGQQLGRKTSDGIEHRPGFDLTFSVPKSWSILHWQTK